MARVRNKIYPEISEEQFGFRKGKGTRDAIFVIRMLGERSLEMQKDLYAIFVDYEKAFDRVKQREIVNDLKTINIDSKDIRLLTNLYWSQLASISIDGELSDWTQIKRGVRQGCVLSPDLFSIYAELIVRRVVTETSFTVNKKSMTNIRYAVDTVLLAENEQDAQQLLDSLNMESERRGLTINQNKTKVLIISKKKEVPRCKVKLNDVQLEQVENFNFFWVVY